MRITDLLDVRSISLNAAPADKSQTLDAAVSLMTRSGKINDEEAYRKQVYAREEESDYRNRGRESPFLMVNVMQ